MIYAFEKNGNPLAPAFALDATLEETRTDNFTVTKKAIETGANVSDYVWAEPKEYSGSGIITASPLDGFYSKDRIKRQFDALVKLADSRTELTVVFGWWVFDGILSNLVTTSSQSIGDALEFSFTFSEIVQFQYETTDIPPSRLKGKAKRRRGTKKGTAQTPKTPTGKNQKSSLLYKGFNGLSNAGGIISKLTGG